jgi:hypothetical protein
MDTTAETYEVECFLCGEVFASWEGRSSDSTASLVCPHCGHDLLADPALREDGAWQVDSDGDRDDR